MVNISLEQSRKYQKRITGVHMNHIGYHVQERLSFCHVR